MNTRTIRPMICVWCCAVVLVASVATGARPKKESPQADKGKPEHFEKWTPPKELMGKITKTIRNALSNSYDKFDEVEWAGPYKFRNAIHVVWLRYKHPGQDGTVIETTQAFRIYPNWNASGQIIGIGGVQRQNPDAFLERAASMVKDILNKEQSEAQLTGKRIDPTVEPNPKAPTPAAPALRTWTDASGKFSVKAELLDYRKGMVTLLTHDEKAIRLKLNKLSKADQEHVKKQTAKQPSRKQSANPPVKRSATRGFGVGVVLGFKTSPDKISLSISGPPPEPYRTWFEFMNAGAEIFWKKREVTFKLPTKQPAERRAERPAERRGESEIERFLNPRPGDIPGVGKP